jgi:hypothetical protein
LRLEFLIDAIETHERGVADGFENVVTEHEVFRGAVRRERRAGAVP